MLGIEFRVRVHQVCAWAFEDGFLIEQSRAPRITRSTTSKSEMQNFGFGGEVEGMARRSGAAQPISGSGCLHRRSDCGWSGPDTE